MRYISEFRDTQKVQVGLQYLHKCTTQKWTVMEICGGQTHAILRWGLDQLIPHTIRLVHGPGCPVCVTPIEIIDTAITLAKIPNVILCSFGDMLRVPGSKGSLFTARTQGADVRIIYSPTDALRIAEQNPDKEVVLFAIGFETTAPANAYTIIEAKRRNLRNFSALTAHVLVPPAIRLLLSNPNNEVQGFLAPGHVCTVTGYMEYEEISNQFKVPIVVTGFELVDLIYGLVYCVKMLENGKIGVINCYSRSVRAEGNIMAKQRINDVFTIVDQKWRGIGWIPKSGLAIREEFAEFDAIKRFQLTPPCSQENIECLSGLVLQGRITPEQCPAFGVKCNPEAPLGALMVSSEGACAAYYMYKYKKL